MNFSRLYLCCAFLLQAAGTCFSQPGEGQSWTLQQCIEYAIENNIQVKQSRLNVDLSQTNLTQSKVRVLPTLNGNASHSYNFGRTIDPFTNEFATDQVLSQNFSLSSSVTLFSGLQNYNTILQNQFDVMASRYDFEKMKNDIALNIATAYLQILFSQEILDMAISQAEVSRVQLGRTKKLVDAGSLARGSLLDVQAQLATEELAVINGQNNLNLSYLTLQQLMDLDPSKPFSIVKPDIPAPQESPLGADPSQIISKALSTQPEIKSGEMKVKSTEKAEAVAKGGISPSLVLSGSYGTGYSGARQSIESSSISYLPAGYTSQGDTVYSPYIRNIFMHTPFNDQIRDNLNQTAGLYLRIPLFNGLQTRSNISRAKIQRLNAEYSLELAKNQLEKTIQQAYADAVAALKKFHATQKSVEALQEAFAYTEQRFNVGMLNSVDYNTAKNNLARSRSDLLQAKYDFAFRVKILEFYQGKPLTF